MMNKLPLTLSGLVLGVALAGAAHRTFAAEREPPAAAAGLIGRYSSDRSGPEPACVRIDPGIAFDWTDGMPDDRLPPGDFTVIWEGLLRVGQPGKYAFTARANGPVQIWVQGRLVYPGAPSERPPLIPLDSRDCPIRIAYRAPAGKARIHVLWSSDWFTAEVINPRCLAHPPSAERPIADRLAYERGREVVERYGCARCHNLPGVDRSRRPGLAMPHVAQMNPQWVARWIRNPQAVRPGTRMGAPGGTPEEVDAITRNLLTLVQIPEVGCLVAPKWRKGRETDPLDGGVRRELAQAGRKRFYELGCSACHSPETPDAIDVTRGPSLADIGSKWSKAYLRQLMLDSVGRHPTGGMPAYTLDQADVDCLVAYMAMLTIGGMRPDPEAFKTLPTVPKIQLRPGQTMMSPEVFADMKAPIRKRACFACHSPESTLFDGPKLDPKKARWTAGCLRSDRAASYTPQFTLKAADREAVIAFLKNRPSDPSPVASGELAQRMIDRTLYCFACHRRDGTGREPLDRTLAHFLQSEPQARPETMTPPDLSGVGARLVRPWMLETLAGKARSNRPWLTVKMPDFGLSDKQRGQIANRLAQADEIPDLREPPTRETARGLIAAAGTLMSNRGFNCVSCHFVGTSDYRPGKSAPDFTLAARRVSRAWFHRWTANPSRILPGTPMPAFVAPANGVAGEDLILQKDILWHFLEEAARKTPRCDTEGGG